MHNFVLRFFFQFNSDGIYQILKKNSKQVRVKFDLNVIMLINTVSISILSLMNTLHEDRCIIYGLI